MFNTIFWIIIVIIVGGHLLGLYLDILNYSMWSDSLPKKLEGIIDHDDYSTSQKYYRVNRKFGNITSSFNVILILSALFAAWFALLDNSLRDMFSNEIVISLMFFGVIGIVSTILSIPFALYSTFTIEERFGFNRTTLKTFIFDQVKGVVLTLLVGAPILALITWIFYSMGENFWIFIWIVITLFSLFMNMFYSELIVPLFNRQMPLEEGSLRDKIEKMAQKAGFSLTNIYTIDGSKRSTKANAYFSGLGPKKRIVLYDTLIKDLTEEEIVAVLAHEIGHYKRRHSLIMMVAGILQTGLLLYLFSIFSNNLLLAKALGTSNISFHISLFAFILIYTPLSMALSIVMNHISRKNEYAADRFAKEMGCGEDLSSGLKKLSVKNLSNLNPHPTFVFFYYSHPPLLDRVKELER
jgi:STE24 endopeptidase